MLANSWSAVTLSAVGSWLGLDWAVSGVVEGAKIWEGADGLGDVPGGVFPRRASRLYVMPLTCSTSPCSMVPNDSTRPSAGERMAFRLGSRGLTPALRVR